MSLPFLDLSISILSRNLARSHFAPDLADSQTKAPAGGGGFRSNQGAAVSQ